ncbi:MAG: hypothetical protein K2X64_11185 [Rhodocyclaceae bacterium]|nr:hypothetical protein [Rhodocyclaceae bacterium]
MINQQHPFHFLSSLIDGSASNFHLSKYVYVNDSLFDERELLYIGSDDFSESWVNATIKSLASNQELAMHSNVQIRGRTWHIPMIDFSLHEEIASSAIDRLKAFLPRPVIRDMAFFSSGRSFHAYSTTLLSPKEWVDFIGRLLLVNPRDGNPIIDTRWVGHRLIGGFSALRWSNNSGLYLREPEKVQIIF